MQLQGKGKHIRDSVCIQLKWYNPGHESSKETRLAPGKMGHLAC